MNRRSVLAQFGALFGLTAIAPRQAVCSTNDSLSTKTELQIEYDEKVGCPPRMVTDVRLVCDGKSLKLVVEYTEVEYVDCEPATK